MNITVIIPVANKSLAYGLLSSIAKNTKRPTQVIIIDNTVGKIPFHYSTNSLNIKYYRPSRDMGVNASWRYGFEHTAKNCGAISVLNDDLLLNKHFFERTERVLLSQESVVVSCPITVGDHTELREYPRNRFELRQTTKPESWAFTIKKSVLDRIPPVPDHIVKTFFGIDWIYLWTVERSEKIWCVDALNYVWHKGSVTVNRKGLQKSRKQEKTAYQEYVNNYSN